MNLGKKIEGYSFSDISSAASEIWGNFKKGIDTACVVKRYFNHNDTYTWNEINEALMVSGWSTRHLLMLMNKIND